MSDSVDKDQAGELRPLRGEDQCDQSSERVADQDEWPLETGRREQPVQFLRGCADCSGSVVARDLAVADAGAVVRHEGCRRPQGRDGCIPGLSTVAGRQRLKTTVGDPSPEISAASL